MEEFFRFHFTLLAITGIGAACTQVWPVLSLIPLYRTSSKQLLMSWHSTSSTHYIDAILKKNCLYFVLNQFCGFHRNFFFFKDRAIYGSHTRQMSKIPNSWFLIPALNYYFLLRCCPLFPILTSLTSLFTFFSTVDWYFRDRLYSPFRRGILISFTTAQKKWLRESISKWFHHLL